MCVILYAFLSVLQLNKDRLTHTHTRTRTHTHTHTHTHTLSMRQTTCFIVSVSSVSHIWQEPQTLLVSSFKAISVLVSCSAVTQPRSSKNCEEIEFIQFLSETAVPFVVTVSYHPSKCVCGGLL